MRPQVLPTTSVSPRRKVPFCTSSVAVTPRYLSSSPSMTVPTQAPLGLALYCSTSASTRILSSRSSTPMLARALSSTIMVSPPHASGCKPSFGQFFHHALRIGVVLVDLIDGNDDRNAGCTRVADGLLGLRHDAVVSRDDEHDDVRHLRATCAHRDERLMAGRIEEGDLATVDRHLVGAGTLRNAAGLAGRDVGMANAVEQCGLAVVDMTEHRDHRRPILELGRLPARTSPAGCARATGASARAGFSPRRPLLPPRPRWAAI